MRYSTQKISLFIFLSMLLIPAQMGMTATQTSTLKDQQSVAITVYNSNIGLVKETRLVHLPQGVQTLKFMDVAGKIDPTTVKLKSLLDSTSLQILEQNYEYDLTNQQKLLEKFVGQKIELAWLNPESKKEETVTSRHNLSHARHYSSAGRYNLS
jgi:hypothetical protein